MLNQPPGHTRVPSTASLVSLSPRSFVPHPKPAAPVALFWMQTPVYLLGLLAVVGVVFTIAACATNIYTFNRGTDTVDMTAWQAQHCSTNTVSGASVCGDFTIPITASGSGTSLLAAPNVPSSMAAALSVPWCSALTNRFQAIQAFAILNIIFAAAFAVAVASGILWAREYNAWDDPAPLATLHLRLNTAAAAVAAAVPAPGTAVLAPAGESAPPYTEPTAVLTVHPLSHYFLERPLRLAEALLGAAAWMWLWVMIQWATITGTYYNMPQCNAGASTATQLISPSGSYFFFATPRGTGYKMGAAFGLYMVLWCYLTVALLFGLYRYFARASR